MAPWMFKLGAGFASAMKFARAKLAEWHRAGITPDESILQGLMMAQLIEADPKINGKSIIQDDARMHFAAGLSKIAIAWFEAEAAEEAA